MTNNEIIKFLQSKQIPQCGDKEYTVDEEYEAYQRAIDALEQPPAITTNNDEPITVIYPTIFCDDAVSRQTLIKAVYATDFSNWVKRDMEKIIDALPSVQPTADLSEYSDKLWKLAYERGKTEARQTVKWIPVSEMLPEENGDYLVTLENGVVQKLGYSTTQRTTYPKGFYYVKGGLSWRQTINPVIAWMPLPEPYKADMRGDADGRDKY